MDLGPTVNTQRVFTDIRRLAQSSEKFWVPKGFMFPAEVEQGKCCLSFQTVNTCPFGGLLSSAIFFVFLGFSIGGFYV